MATSLIRVPYNVDDYPRRDGFIILCGNLDDAPSLYEVLSDTVPENKPVGQIDPPAQRLYSNVITNELGVDHGQISVEFSWPEYGTFSQKYVAIRPRMTRGELCAEVAKLVPKWFNELQTSPFNPAKGNWQLRGYELDPQKIRLEGMASVRDNHQPHLTRWLVCLSISRVP